MQEGGRSVCVPVSYPEPRGANRGRGQVCLTLIKHGCEPEICNDQLVISFVTEEDVGRL